jgi:hypothetical protein
MPPCLVKVKALANMKALSIACSNLHQDSGVIF